MKSFCTGQSFTCITRGGLTNTSLATSLLSQHGRQTGFELGSYLAFGTGRLSLADPPGVWGGEMGTTFKCSCLDLRSGQH